MNLTKYINFKFLIIFITIIWLLSGFYIIPFTSVGLIFNLIKENVEIKGPGLNYSLPYPIKKKKIINNKEIRQNKISDISFITGDENIVNLSLAYQYQIYNPKKYYFNFSEELIENIAISSIYDIISNRDLDHCLTVGREEISISIKSKIQQSLDSNNTGILLNNVTLLDVDPPTETKDAFDDVIRAKNDEQRIKNEAKAYYNDIIPKARGNAQKLIEEAYGYKQIVVTNAKIEAEEFDGIIKDTEEIDKEKIYLEKMGEIIKKNDIIINTDDSNHLTIKYNK
jgi:modulator of FtsH protease HflK